MVNLETKKERKAACLEFKKDLCKATKEAVVIFFVIFVSALFVDKCNIVSFTLKDVVAENYGYNTIRTAAIALVISLLLLTCFSPKSKKEWCLAANSTLYKVSDSLQALILSLGVFIIYGALFYDEKFEPRLAVILVFTLVTRPFFIAVDKLITKNERWLIPVVALLYIGGLILF
ncbi:hypothetical protein [Vibrio mimicus]|uniref:hypothetical protein n=1 Tax=Vibrio mimicus TaxID=674 RepID=UPI000877EE7C|nr:hypothetical protein [Vibrio mimicus]AOW83548.1 hypothetical protein VM_12850 [Vibrio mimicus]